MSSKVIRASEAAPGIAAWRPSNHGAAPALQDWSASNNPAPHSNARMTPEAARDNDAKIKAAHQQGRAEGEAAAMKLALAKVEPMAASFSGIVQELTAVRKTFRASAELDTVKLAVAIARRLLHRELSTDPDAILGLVTSAFQKLNARETYKLRVSASDAQVLQQQRARLNFPPSLEIAADPALTPGSAIFETSRGELDASIDTQLAEIDRGFADIVRRRTH